MRRLTTPAIATPSSFRRRSHTNTEVFPCLPQLHDRGLGCSRFARRYSGNGFTFRSHPRCFLGENVKWKILFLFLWVLRCFTSPGSRPTAMYWLQDNTALPVLGFPIRRSSDQRLLATSPKLIAGCYVLHRHVLSSHPPYALMMLYNHFCVRWYLTAYSDERHQKCLFLFYPIQL